MDNENIQVVIFDSEKQCFVFEQLIMFDVTDKKYKLIWKICDSEKEAEHFNGKGIKKEVWNLNYIMPQNEILQKKVKYSARRKNIIYLKLINN